MDARQMVQSVAPSDIASLISNDIAPGRGYNCFTQKPTSDVLKSATLKPVIPEVMGGFAPYQILQLDSYRDYLRETRTSISVWGEYGAASASLDYSAATSTFEAETRLYLFVHARFEAPALVYKDRVLTAQAVNWAKGDYKEFLERCGTHYVAGVVPGASITGTVTLTTKRGKSYADTKLAVNAAVAAFNAKGGTKSAFADAITRITNSASYSMAVARQGGGDTIPSNPHELIEEAINLPNLPTSQLTGLRPVLEEYSSAANWPDGQLEKLFRIRDCVVTVAGINSYLLEASVKRADVNYIAANAAAFIPPSGETVASWASGAGAQLQKLIDNAKARRHAIVAQHAPPAPVDEILPPLPPTSLKRVVKPPAKVLTLWKDAGRRGPSASYSASDPRVGRTDISSVKLAGRPGQYVAVLYRERNFRGEARLLTSPATIDNLDGTQHQDHVRSVALHKNF